MFDEVGREADRIENLRAAIGLVGRYSHLEITFRIPLPTALM